MIQPQALYSDQQSATLYVNELAHIARYFNDESSDCHLALTGYRDNLTAICEQLTDLTIVDLLLILIDGLDQLIEGDVPLSNEHCRFLSKLPILISDCLSYGDSKMPAIVLIRTMASQSWARPLSKEEETYYIGQVVHGIENRAEMSDQSGNVDMVDVLDFSTPDTADFEPDYDQDAADEGVQIESFEINGHQSGDQDIAILEANEVESLDDVIEFESSNTPDQETSIELEHVHDYYSDMNIAMDSPSSNTGSTAINDEHQALIDLVCMELAEVVENTDQQMTMDVPDYENALTGVAVQAEHLGNAIELLGLEGLARFCKQVADNAARTDPANHQAVRVLLNWAQLAQTYLKNLFDPRSVQLLLDYFRHNQAIFNIDSSDIMALSNLLTNPVFAQEEKPPRQQTANPDDMDLALPDDVNQELLDGLLQDLPAQTGEFSSSIQRLADAGDIHALETAQRIAHTLKGAANVVGVKGIANLTHHLEDILETQARSGKPPVKALMDVLMSASDCLEAMAEALLGIDSPPDDAVQIFQRVLDWANRLEQGGVVRDSDMTVNEAGAYLPSVVDETPVEVDKKTPGDITYSENMLRVPASLADELLRLAGENLITTGQIQDRIKNTLKHYGHLKTHNQSLQQLSFDLEHLVDIQGITNNLNTRTNTSGTDFDPLEMDDFHELHAVSRRLIELSADSFELSKAMELEVAELSNLVIAQDNIQKESQQLVMRTRMVPVKTIVPRLKRGIRQASRVTGKQVELVVMDNDTYLDSEVLNDMIEPLMHILRNAVDHGIETAEERQSSHKQVQGLVEIAFNRMGDLVVINIKDDGRGLDEAKILTKAIQRGLVRKDQALSRDEIFRLILEQGLSTREEVTQVSGRGIGLDVVNIKIRDLKGMINIYSDKGQGTRLELILPVTSFSTHSLLIRVRKNIYAISSRGVEEILYPGLGKLTDMGNEMIFQVDDQAYGAIILDQLFNLPEDARNLDRNARPVIIVKEETGAKRAILVQEVLDSRDVVVKPLGRYMPKMKGVVGATILGNGSVAPVIDLPELLQKSRILPAHGHDSGRKSLRGDHSRQPYVLVVDDSLSARRSLTQFVQDLGMDVRSARDGMEAVSLIEARKPDLVLVDMEMPRMNGLELASHIRGTESTADTPIVMITSRSSAKHKAAAMQRGVNHFMVKPFAEDELAKIVHSVLEVGTCNTPV